MSEYKSFVLSYYCQDLIQNGNSTKLWQHLEGTTSFHFRINVFSVLTEHTALTSVHSEDHNVYKFYLKTIRAVKILINVSTLDVIFSGWWLWQEAKPAFHPLLRPLPWAYSSTPKIEVRCSYGTLGFLQTTWSYNPEYHIHQKHTYS